MAPDAGLGRGPREGGTDTKKCLSILSSSPCPTGKAAFASVASPKKSPEE